MANRWMIESKRSDEREIVTWVEGELREKTMAFFFGPVPTLPFPNPFPPPAKTARIVSFFFFHFPSSFPALWARKEREGTLFSPFLIPSDLIEQNRISSSPSLPCAQPGRQADGASRFCTLLAGKSTLFFSFFFSFLFPFLSFRTGHHRAMAQSLGDLSSYLLVNSRRRLKTSLHLLSSPPSWHRHARRFSWVMFPAVRLRKAGFAFFFFPPKPCSIPSLLTGRRNRSIETLFFSLPSSREDGAALYGVHRCGNRRSLLPPCRKDGYHLWRSSEKLPLLPFLCHVESADALAFLPMPWRRRPSVSCSLLFFSSLPAPNGGSNTMTGGASPVL